MAPLPPLPLTPTSYTPLASDSAPSAHLDRKMESWKVGAMKMTLDLPAELVREMKLRAAGEGRKLRDVATEIFRRGLTRPSRPAGKIRHRVPLPLIDCKAPRTKSEETTPEKVADVLGRQESAWCHEASGR
jgi:plasmid stability protein